MKRNMFTNPQFGQTEHAIEVCGSSNDGGGGGIYTVLMKFQSVPLTNPLKRLATRGNLEIFKLPN